MDTGIGHQVGLKLRQVDIEGSVESQGSCDRRDDLTNESIQVGVGGSLDVQVSSADVVDGFIVDHEGAIGMLQGSVGGQDGVVWLNDGRRNLRGRVDGKFQLRLFAIVNRQTFHKKG